MFVHVGPNPPQPQRLEPLTYYDDDIKPRYGFWSSTKSSEYGTDWVRYLATEYSGVHYSIEKEYGAWELVPHDDARILRIETDDDFEYFYNEYYVGIDCGEVRYDWQRVAKHYDAFHLVDYKYIRNWDCESVVWFRFKFDVREYVCPKIDHHVSVMRDREDACTWLV